MLGAMLIFILISVGTFFAISTRMRQNIIQLDALSMAVGKRVVDLDATLGTFTESTQSFNELTEKLEKLSEAQSGIEKKFDEVTKAVSTVPGQIAEQSGKGMDGKFVAIEKQMQALDAKIVALTNRPQAAPPPPGLSQQALSAELQKLKKELEQTALKSRENASVAHAAPKSSEEAKPAPAPKVERKPEPKAESRPEPKPAAPSQAQAQSAPTSAPAPAPTPVPSASVAPAPMPQFQPAREKMLVYPRPNNE
jgi:outer membrane biosynthesis protein TonB